MKNIIGFSFFSFLLVMTSFVPVEVQDYKVDIVVIDAGHGGKDPGTHGKKAKEKDIALSIALELGATIKTYLPDVKVIYTRDDDTFIPLDKRAEIANKNGADLFISVHCNASPSSWVRGTETWVMGLHKTADNLKVAMRENSVIDLEEGAASKYGGFDPNSPESYILFSLYQNAYLNNSVALAEKVEKQFKERAGRKSLGVKSAGFLVLWKTSMPSILVETGYLSNVKEESELRNKLVQSYIASGIFRAFRDYKSEIEATN